MMPYKRDTTQSGCTDETSSFLTTNFFFERLSHWQIQHDLCRNQILAEGSRLEASEPRLQGMHQQ